MATKLFVRSLAYATTEEDLANFFATVGRVKSAKVIFDHETNRSKGYGFVEMETEAEAQKAMHELNGKRLDGRAIFIDEARPQERRDEQRTFAAAQPQEA